MRIKWAPILAVVVLAGPIAFSLVAQPPRQGREEPGGFRGAPDDVPRDDRPRGERRGFGPPGGPPDMMQVLPIMVALDADRDGILSKDEINNAVAALKGLDKNEDGKLTLEELRPDGSAMRGRFGRLGGFGRPREDGRPPKGPGSGRGPERQDLEDSVSHMMDLDKNNDGKLAKDELPERMRGMLRGADANGDGYVTKEELIAMVERQRRSFRESGGRRRTGDPDSTRSPEELVKRIFEDSDSDEDGKLSQDEVPERMAARFEQVDSNSDGSIDKQELQAAMERVRGGGRDGGRGPGGRRRADERPDSDYY